MYSRFISKVTELMIGLVTLLFDAWHVYTMCRCRLSIFWSFKTFFTRFSDNIIDESSNNVFSCHHTTFGNGRPGGGEEYKREEMEQIFLWKKKIPNKRMFSLHSRSLENREWLWKSHISVLEPTLTLSHTHLSAHTESSRNVYETSQQLTENHIRNVVGKWTICQSYTLLACNYECMHATECTEGIRGRFANQFDCFEAINLSVSIWVSHGKRYPIVRNPHTGDRNPRADNIFAQKISCICRAYDGDGINLKAIIGIRFRGFAWIRLRNFDAELFSIVRSFVHIKN